MKGGSVIKDVWWKETVKKFQDLIKDQSQPNIDKKQLGGSWTVQARSL